MLPVIVSFSQRDATKSAVQFMDASAKNERLSRVSSRTVESGKRIANENQLSANARRFASSNLLFIFPRPCIKSQRREK